MKTKARPRITRIWKLRCRVCSRRSRVWRTYAQIATGVIAKNSTRTTLVAQFTYPGVGVAFEAWPNPVRLAKATTASRTSSASRTLATRKLRPWPWGNGCMRRELRRAAADFVERPVKLAGWPGWRESGRSSRARRAESALRRRKRWRTPGATVVSGSRRDGSLDVTDEESCRRFVDGALAQLGGLDILVNNAGLSRGRDPVWDPRRPTRAR